jgi:hypothetical protein
MAGIDKKRTSARRKGAGGHSSRGGGLSISDAMADPAVFGPWCNGESWNGWRAVLKAAFALPMTAGELAFFHEVAGDRSPPERPVKELWCIVGRRGGKDSIASIVAAYTAAMFQDQGRLRPGERALVACLATDRDQAKIILNYTRAYFSEIPLLRALVSDTEGTASSFELENRVDVSILTSNFRAVRGRPILCGVLDECAFMRDDQSANPDVEVYNALRPGLASLPNSILIGISTPYAKSGLLYKKFCDHFGKNSPDTLVIKAPTRALNPTIDPAVIDAAMADDPAAAAAEWLAEFRDDVQGFLTRDVIDAATAPGRHELPPMAACSYCAFIDPSGGSRDSMTLAVSHLNGDRAVLDLIRERRAPFSPDDVVAEFAATLREYHITTVTGDRFGGEWPREQFRSHGIEYVVSERSKNDIYREFLPLVNSRRVELLDNQRLVAQLCSLERRTARGGKDSIDHPPGGQDDIANAIAGSILLAVQTGTNAWQRAAMTPPTPAPSNRRADLVYAVLIHGRHGIGICIFAYGRNWRAFNEPLALLEADELQLSPTMFDEIGRRVADHRRFMRADHAIIFASSALAAEARRCGCGIANIDPLLAENAELLELSAAVYLTAGRIKATTPQLAAKLAAAPTDDPIKRAMVLGVVLTFDQSRSLDQRAA